MNSPLIVLDTGVVISALVGSREASSHLVCLAVGTGDLRLATSDGFFVELVETVRRKVAQGFISDPARAFEVGLDVGYQGVHIRDEPLPWPSISDPKDWWMANLAYHSFADFIVSNDPHIISAELPIPVETLTARQMIERLRDAP